MLTILLAATFREVHVVWSTSIDDGPVDRVKPDTVLTERAGWWLHLTVDGGFAAAARVAAHAAAVTAGRRWSREASPHGQGSGLTRPAAFDRRR
ncbi:hypothetical protein [Methylobacterium sp. A52T]